MVYFIQKNRVLNRKGKLQVIEGRKAVHPEISGQAGYRS